MIDFNDKRQVAKAIQYTNVNPNLTREGMLKHLETCMKYDFQAAMVAPCYIEPVSYTHLTLKGNRNPGCVNLKFPDRQRYPADEDRSPERDDQDRSRPV